MRIDNFDYMIRQGSELKAVTRFLLNGRLDGPPGHRRIVKLSGYENHITSRSIDVGGTLTPEGNGLFYKHPSHGYATLPTAFMVDGNNFYYYNSTSEEWVRITWNSQLVVDFTPNSDVRYWFERGELHIAAGINGRSAIYTYIDREKTTDENGYFNNNIEHVGFWFGAEEIQQFSASTETSVGWAFQVTENDNMDEDIEHYIMGIYNCDGQEAIYKKDSKVFINRGGVTGAAVIQIMLFIDSSTLDKRVTDVDLYGAIARRDELKKRRSGMPIHRLMPLNKHHALNEGGQDESELDWKLLRRLSINHDTILAESDDYTAEYVSDTKVKIEIGAGASTLNNKFAYANAFLNDKFYLGFRNWNTGTWSYSLITDTLYQDPDATHMTFEVADASSFSVGVQYTLRLVARWQLQSGTTYKLWWLWLDSDGDLGDPFDVDQDYSIVNEYFPKYQFAAVQDRRTYRLSCYTDKLYKNMMLWSEVDKPLVVPNRNFIFFNTKTDEEPKGLEVVRGGLLAVYENSCHYARTGEIVRYDAEEGQFDVDCVASKSIVMRGENAYWCGKFGIKRFRNGMAEDITDDKIADDYVTIIESEYTNNSNSYEGIVGGYCKKNKLIVWSFPNSTATVSSKTIKIIVYDTVRDGFAFMDSAKDFLGFVNDYDGELYGIDTDAIYKLFSDSPFEHTQLIWEGGKIMTDGFDNLNVKGVRARYKGIPTLKGYHDSKSTSVINQILKTFSSDVSNWILKTPVNCEDIKFRIEFNPGIAIDILEMIDIVAEKIPR